MAPATEAPASVTAEGPTSHTQNQVTPRRRGALSDLQINWLLRPVEPDRVGSDGKGFSHMEAWDIKRHMIRIFGFGGHDIDLLDVTLISQSSKMLRKKNRDHKEYGEPYEAWTVIYRVSVKLTVKVGGIELGHWTGVATGDATNQPSLADAHDLALKTADSQALKRAATNLGDQFGLSLYNKGRLSAVVQSSLAYWKKPEAAQFKDEKVEADPEVAAAQQQAVSTEAEATPAASANPPPTTSDAAAAPVRAATTAATGRDYLHEAREAPTEARCAPCMTRPRKMVQFPPTWPRSHRSGRASPPARTRSTS
ncbi:Rad52/Rad22 family DNA repair protein [Streptomyces microflavus]|uniref:Rad52/Rad22 family DNA repair protein n=1 Tax=Streptomyces microflavus TaxID=1919 RepID=UPI003B219187